jgi:hypothetical protein
LARDNPSKDSKAAKKNEKGRKLLAKMPLNAPAGIFTKAEGWFLIMIFLDKEDRKNEIGRRKWQTGALCRLIYEQSAQK